MRKDEVHIIWMLFILVKTFSLVDFQAVRNIGRVHPLPVGRWVATKLVDESGIHRTHAFYCHYSLGLGNAAVASRILVTRNHEHTFSDEPRHFADGKIYVQAAGYRSRSGQGEPAHSRGLLGGRERHPAS